MNKTLNYKINHSKRAKNISIRINDTGEITVTVPMRRYGISSSQITKQAHDFVNKNKDWIKKHINITSKKFPKIQFKPGASIPYLGKSLKLYVIPKDITRPKVKATPDSLVVFANTKISKQQNKPREAVTNFFKKQFRALIANRVEEYNKSYGFRYNRIAIKDNKTNWGSCSSKKNLNFNWRLIFAPLDIIDYVAVHELCHLKEQNHSKNFWTLVERQIPNHKTYRKWLRENGIKLRI